MEGEVKEAENKRKFFQRKSSNKPQRQKSWQEKIKPPHSPLRRSPSHSFHLSASPSVPFSPFLSLSLRWMTPRSFHPLHCSCQSHFLSPSFCRPLSFLLTKLPSHSPQALLYLSLVAFNLLLIFLSFIIKFTRIFHWFLPLFPICISHTRLHFV